MNDVSYFSVHLTLLFPTFPWILFLLACTPPSIFFFLKSSFYWPLTFLSIISSISLSLFFYLSSWLSDLSFISSISDLSVNTTCFSLSCVFVCLLEMIIIISINTTPTWVWVFEIICPKQMNYLCFAVSLSNMQVLPAACILFQYLLLHY